MKNTSLKLEIKSLRKKEIELFYKILNATRHFNESLRPEDKIKLSKKGKKIYDLIIKGGFGCRTNTILEIFSAMLNEKLPEFKNNSVKPIKYAITMLLENTNGNNYGINEPFIFCSNESYSTHLRLQEIAYGNHVPTNIEPYKLLSDSEVTKIFIKYKNIITKQFIR